MFLCTKIVKDLSARRDRQSFGKLNVLGQKPLRDGLSSLVTYALLFFFLLLMMGFFSFVLFCFVLFL